MFLLSGAEGAKNLQGPKNGLSAQQHETAGLWRQMVVHLKLDIVLRGLDMDAEDLSLS